MTKKLKKLLSKRNNGGFTMVEVIVSAALLGVLLLGMLAFVSPVLNNIHDNEKNARALNVGSCIEHYISRSLRYANYVAIFQNAKYDDTQASGDITSPNIPEKIAAMKAFVTSAENIAVYELKCISLKWTMDEKTQEYKYMLYQEGFRTNTAEIDPAKAKPVFDGCLYDALYPEVKFTMTTNQGDWEGAPTVDPADIKVRPSHKIEVNIYDDPGMDFHDLVFVGTGYTEYLNIKSKDNPDDASSPTGKKYRIYTGVETFLRTDADVEADSSIIGPGDIYIYYVARKATYNSTTP